MLSVLIPAEEEWSHEGAGEEGEVEGEKGGQAAKEGRPGGGGGRGECPAGGGPPGEWLPPPCWARTGEDEREASEEDLLQEEQNGQCAAYMVLTRCFFETVLSCCAILLSLLQKAAAKTLFAPVLQLIPNQFKAEKHSEHILAYLSDMTFIAAPAGALRRAGCRHFSPLCQSSIESNRTVRSWIKPFLLKYPHSP